VWGFGGLHIVGTERHESRRIDNQCVDAPDARAIPAARRFFYTLQDDLMRILRRP